MAKKTVIGPPIVAGNNYKLEITGLGQSGEGVGRYGDFTVFVPYALPGEQVSVRVVEVKKSYARGELRKIINPSAYRTEPICPVYQACGGCQLQHLSYREQLVWKRRTVIDALTRIGKLGQQVTVHPLLSAEDQWHYRNKMQLPIGLWNGEVVAGCFARGSHQIIDTDTCRIQHSLNNDIAARVKEAVRILGLSLYDERTGKGLVRHVMGRVGAKTGEVMLVLVTNGREIPLQDKLITILRKNIPALVGIVQNINIHQTNIILGQESRTLWGQAAITDYIGSLKFKISARSFFQVNTAQAEVLYAQTLAYAGLTGRETVIDAYCGTGTITLCLAAKAQRAYGIEVVSEAIEDARENAALNGITNAEFRVGDAVDLLPLLYAQGIRPDVIVVDPPRAGCDREVLAVFCKMQPRRIIYVSCNPGTLARDLAYLEQEGFPVREITPVDMFPQTSHVECVALITRE